MEKTSLQANAISYKCYPRVARTFDNSTTPPPVQLLSSVLNNAAISWLFLSLPPKSSPLARAGRVYPCDQGSCALMESCSLVVLEIDQQWDDAAVYSMIARNSRITRLQYTTVDYKLWMLASIATSLREISLTVTGGDVVRVISKLEQIAQRHQLEFHLSLISVLIPYSGFDKPLISSLNIIPT